MLFSTKQGRIRVTYLNKQVVVENKEWGGPDLQRIVDHL